MTTASPTLLPELSTRARDAIVALGQRRRFAADEIIIGEGQPLESMYVVIKGHVKMSRLTPAGKNLILSLFGPGEPFGVTAVLSGERCDSSLTAAVDTECLIVSRADLLGLFTHRPDLVPELLRLLTRNLAECRSCLIESVCSRVEIRFAHLFVSLSEKMGQPTDNGGSFVPLPLSRQDLADMTGTTIETAIRLMSRWGKAGLVTTMPDGFRIDEPNLLVQLTWS